MKGKTRFASVSVRSEASASAPSDTMVTWNALSQLFVRAAESFVGHISSIEGSQRRGGRVLLAVRGGAGACFSRCHVGGVFLSFLCCVLPALRLLLLLFLLLLFLLLPLLLLFAFALAVFAMSGDEVR